MANGVRSKRTARPFTLDKQEDPMHKLTLGRKLFLTGNYLLIGFLSITCLLPLWQELMISLSANSVADAGYVKLWPIKFNLSSYSFALSNPQFLQSLTVSLERILLGVSLCMLMTVLASYPLAKDKGNF